MGLTAPSAVELRFVVEEPSDRWRLEEEDVPETPQHAAIIQLLRLILEHWVEASGRSALVTSNLACRWDPSDARVGTDPDVVLVEPRPPGGEALRSLRVWEPGHAPPRIAVEVVSHTDPRKDYAEAPLRCARLGARELWVFDPGLHGPDDTGGPFPVQIWRLEETAGRLRTARTYAGSGPGFSEELGAWLVVTDEGTRLRIADDADGRALWPTAFETERAELERERAERERLADELRSLGHDPDAV